jgi:trans-2,3-dihydro-3-hydroxyanthranilate isomerase
MKRRFLTLDVFTRRRFAGNPLAVVLDADELDSEAMQAIAREFNHPETVFVLPPKDGAHRAALRIFTPAAELPFAGHPTVGATVALAFVAQEEVQAFVLEEQVGPVACSVQMSDASCGRAEFKLPRLPGFAGEAPDIASIGAALSLDASDIRSEPYAPSRWSAGLPYPCILLRSLDATRRARPAPDKFNAVFGGSGGRGNVFLLCEQTVEPGHDFHARMFAPMLGIPEDPATGSAVAAFAGLYAAAAKPADGQHRLVIEQGYEMGRPSLIELSLGIARGELSEASIGGHAVVVTEGSLNA